MPALLLAIHLLIAQQPISSQASPQITDSIVRARVDAEIRAFLFEWRDVWEQTQDDRPQFDVDDLRHASDRVRALHCHWNTVGSGLSTVGQHRIASSVIAHNSCPLWYPREAPARIDERRRIDGGLRWTLRGQIQFVRLNLLAFLDSAAAHLPPGDLRIAQQRVRFALDANDLRRAWQSAVACAENEAHCTLLRGLVLYRAGDVAGADVVFQTGARMLSDAERCAWNDVGMLLEPEMRKAYSAMSCAQRADFETRFWWLADPLFGESGNERRAEHFARKVLIELVTAYPNDGRQRFERAKGGEAVIETLIRYGWPTQMYWAGPTVDRAHDNYLLANAADTAGPYVVREYSRDRQHTVPKSSAFLAPFAAKPDDWQLNPPRDDRGWWPTEHYARDRNSIVQLPSGQGVMLRRRNLTRAVWAAPLDTAVLGRGKGDSVTATLWQSRAVDVVDSVASYTGIVGRTLIVDALLRSGEALIGIETDGDRDHPVARTRFGAVIDMPLAALAGARALSQPLLFEPAAQPGALLDADAAIKRMYATTTLAKRRRVGVYWESYGFASTDSIDIEVSLDRQTRPNIFTRVGRAFGIAIGGAPIGARWRELSADGRAIQTFEGSVPVLMRSIVLDLSSLDRGLYRVKVTVSDARGRSASNDRLFELR